MLKRLLRLIMGLCLYSVAIIMTVKAQIGYAPWDTFHYGLSAHIGLSYGNTAILVGGVTVVIAILLGEQIGIGTLLNMTLIGFFCDFLLNHHIIQTPSTFVGQVGMLLSGLFVMSFASYFYISASFGAGPRDSLMVGLSKRLKLPVGLCRNIIELSVLGIGWSLGGAVGLGTVLSAIIMGFFIQIVFKWMRFDAKSIKHQTFAVGKIKQTLKSEKSCA